jgi:formamidopyrimidine-DNA glycosylase
VSAHCALSTGRTIEAAQLKLPRTAPTISARTFARKLKGARIEGVTRRGKYILIELDHGVSCSFTCA